MATYSELQAEIADILNRDDLTVQIKRWIKSVHTKLEEYVGELNSLILDADTNDLLEYDTSYYSYGAVVHGAAFLGDDAMMTRYGGLWQELLNELPLGGQGQTTVPSTGNACVILP